MGFGGGDLIRGKGHVDVDGALRHGKGNRIAPVVLIPGGHHHRVRLHGLDMAPFQEGDPQRHGAAGQVLIALTGPVILPAILVQIVDRQCGGKVLRLGQVLLGGGENALVPIAALHIGIVHRDGLVPLVPEGDGIAVILRQRCDALEEQMVRIAGGVGDAGASAAQVDFLITVAVGDIRQIPFAVEQHVVPHMGSGTVGGGQISLHQVALRVPLKVRQITQVLEGLGVALTDHVGVRVPVEHVDQLPGVSKSHTDIGCGIVVILHPVLDFHFIGPEQVIIRQPRVVVHNALGHVGGPRRGLGQFSVDGVQGFLRLRV